MRIPIIIIATVMVLTTLLSPLAVDLSPTAMILYNYFGNFTTGVSTAALIIAVIGVFVTWNVTDLMHGNKQDTLITSPLVAHNVGGVACGVIALANFMVGDYGLAFLWVFVYADAWLLAGIWNESYYDSHPDEKREKYEADLLIKEAHAASRSILDNEITIDPIKKRKKSKLEEMANE